MANALLCDISSWQPANVDWASYINWSKQGDGVSRVIFRASQGTNLKDANFETYWANATSAGVDVVGVYHYCYPQFNSPQNEANWFYQCVGSRLRATDFIMIDFEENNSSATDIWLLQFAQALENKFGKVPYVYSYLSLIQNNLHNNNLSKYPLVLADWTFDPSARPACPPPFVDMEYVQFSDKFNVPGIGVVDADVFVGKGIPMSAVPAYLSMYFTENSDGSWHCSNGNDISSSIQQWYESFGAVVLEEVGLPVTGDSYVSGSNNQAVDQWFERARAVYDPNRVVENVTVVTSPVYRGRIDHILDDNASLKIQVSNLNTQVDDLNTQIAALNAEIAQLKASPVPPIVKQSLQDADTLLGSLANVGTVKSEVDSALKALG